MSLPKPGRRKALDKCRGGRVGWRDGNGAGLNLGERLWSREQWGSSTGEGHSGQVLSQHCWACAGVGELCGLGEGSWASWGYHQPAPHCTLWHSWSTTGLYLGGKGTLCQWCWGGGSAEMQPQCPPQGVMCPQTMAGPPPPCLQHTGICGEQGQIPAGNVPTCPRAPVWFLHTLSMAAAVLFVCWCFISHSLFSFKPPYGAVCRCRVRVCPHSWPGSPLGF